MVWVCITVKRLIRYQLFTLSEKFLGFRSLVRSGWDFWCDIIGVNGGSGCQRIGVGIERERVLRTLVLMMFLMCLEGSLRMDMDWRVKWGDSRS